MCALAADGGGALSLLAAQSRGSTAESSSRRSGVREKKEKNQEKQGFSLWLQSTHFVSKAPGKVSRISCQMPFTHLVAGGALERKHVCCLSWSAVSDVKAGSCWMLAATCVWRLELRRDAPVTRRMFGSVLKCSLRVSDVMNHLYVPLLAIGRGSQVESLFSSLLKRL